MWTIAAYPHLRSQPSCYSPEGILMKLDRSKARWNVRSHSPPSLENRLTRLHPTDPTIGVSCGPSISIARTRVPLEDQNHESSARRSSGRPCPLKLQRGPSSCRSAWSGSPPVWSPRRDARAFTSAKVFATLLVSVASGFLLRGSTIMRGRQGTCVTSLCWESSARAETQRDHQKVAA